jgi:hypothetical protein
MCAGDLGQAASGECHHTEPEVGIGLAVSRLRLPQISGAKADDTFV